MLQEKLDAQEKNHSPFEDAVRKLATPACKVFRKGQGVAPVAFEETGEALRTEDSARIAAAFPRTRSQDRILAAKGPSGKPVRGKRVAVLFSGGPAAGGHNVVAGLKRVLGRDNTLLGVKAGPAGLIKGDVFEIADADVERIFNTGGFDFLGSDRTKIKSDEQFAAVRKTCRDNKLDGIVVVGGDDSNTNAAVLAEYLAEDGVKVIGVPKTIDGDLQAGSWLPISFGFDTATRIYAEMTGNVLQDTPSSRKYWHFIRLMGRAASHVTLEVALQTRPAVALISEEIEAKGITLAAVIEQIAQAVVTRARKGINHGCVVIPEGLIEFIPDLKGLMAELNDAMAKYSSEFASLSPEAKPGFIVGRLSQANAKIFSSLPNEIERQLLLERDSHGNVQVTQIPTEKLLIDMVAARVKEIDPKVKFATQNHFFGYEGRCGAPSLFDAAYTYILGLAAGCLVLDGRTGYIVAVTDFDKGGRVLALPLIALMNVERRGGKDEYVIKKALVTVDSPAFKYFATRRAAWAAEDRFASPGPRQLWGPTANQLPITVALNQGYSDLGFSIGG
jgi:pyrophosphate--fructose-6-phosphate 1-phosphotransferase